MTVFASIRVIITEIQKMVGKASVGSYSTFLFDLKVYQRKILNTFEFDCYLSAYSKACSIAPLNSHNTNKLSISRWRGLSPRETMAAIALTLPANADDGSHRILTSFQGG